MPNYVGTITQLVAGDFRQIPWTISNVPTGGSVTKGWFTVKASPNDLDISAIFQKIITGSLDATKGQITSSGSGTGVAAGFFNLLATETLLMTPDTPYYYDMQFQITMGDATTRLETPEIGTITTLDGITDAVS